MIKHTTEHIARQAASPLPAFAAPTADLNEVVGQLVRELCPAAMVVRRDRMPEVTGSVRQLHEAFRLLLCHIVAHPPATGTHFLYFKCREPEVVQIGHARKAELLTLGIFTNLHPAARNADNAVRHFSQACSLFEANGITLVQPHCSGDDCIFLLTIAGKPD